MPKKLNKNFLGCKHRLNSQKDFCINKSKRISKIEDFNSRDINTNLKHDNFYKVSKYKILNNNLYFLFFFKIEV